MKRTWQRLPVLFTVIVILTLCLSIFTAPTARASTASSLGTYPSVKILVNCSAFVPQVPQSIEVKDYNQNGDWIDHTFNSNVTYDNGTYWWWDLWVKPQITSTYNGISLTESFDLSGYSDGQGAVLWTKVC